MIECYYKLPQNDAAVWVIKNCAPHNDTMTGVMQIIYRKNLDHPFLHQMCIDHDTKIFQLCFWLELQLNFIFIFVIIIISVLMWCALFWNIYLINLQYLSEPWWPLYLIIFLAEQLLQRCLHFFVSVEDRLNSLTWISLSLAFI